MFAYVQFASDECERHSSKDIVDVENIKNFDVLNWKKSKYYKIKCGPGKCKGSVIFVENNIEDLTRVIAAKRAVIPPKNTMSSAVDDTTDVEGVEVTTKKKKDKSEEINKRLQGKISKIKEGISYKENVLSISKNIGDQKKKSDVNAVSRNIKETKLASSSDCKEPLLHKNDGTKCKNKCFDSSHANLEKQIYRMKEQISAKDSKIIEQTQMVAELTSLNMELQKSVIANMEYFKATAVQLKEFTSREGLDAPPVGLIRKADNHIHLGRNVWISKDSYDVAFKNARWTNAMKVKNLAVAVFGLKVLETSSISGTVCNRYKNTKAKPPLDRIKILAIQDIYFHWLKTVKKMPVIEAEIESAKVTNYIRGKISDLCRASNENKKSNKDARVKSVNGVDVKDSTMAEVDDANQIEVEDAQISSDEDEEDNEVEVMADEEAELFEENEEVEVEVEKIKEVEEADNKEKEAEKEKEIDNIINPTAVEV